MNSQKRRRARGELFLRDPAICVYCNVRLIYGDPQPAKGTKPATLEHIIAKSNGGLDHIDNLVLSCRPCNNRRGDKPFLLIYCEG